MVHGGDRGIGGGGNDGASPKWPVLGVVPGVPETREHERLAVGGVEVKRLGWSLVTRCGPAPLVESVEHQRRPALPERLTESRPLGGRLASSVYEP